MLLIFKFPSATEIDEICRGGQERLGLVRRVWVWSGEVGSGQESLGLVRRGWIWSGEVGSGQERLGLVRRGWSGEFGSGQERLGLVRRGWVWSGEVGSGQERLGLVRRGWVWSGKVGSGPYFLYYKLTCLQIAQRERERELLLQHLLQYEQEAWELQSEMNNAHSEKHKLLKKQQGQYFVSWEKTLGATWGSWLAKKVGYTLGYKVGCDKN